MTPTSSIISKGNAFVSNQSKQSTSHRNCISAVNYLSNALFAWLYYQVANRYYRDVLLENMDDQDPERLQAIEQFWYEQKLDHFSADETTWYQQAWVDQSNFKVIKHFQSICELRFLKGKKVN